MTLICSHSVYTLLIIAFSTWHIFYFMFDFFSLTKLMLKLQILCELE